MTRIALFSDLHLASEPEQRAYGQWPLENLKAAIGQLKEFSPEYLVISGDCAYKMGLPANYEALATFLQEFESLGVKVSALVGNHDHRGYLREVLGNPKSSVDGLLTAKVEFPEATWLFLDTQLGLHEVRGCVGQRQMEWIGEELSKAPAKSFIVVGHHHPEDSRRKDSFPEIGLRDTEQWLEFLGKHHQIKAYVFGHTHSWYHEQLACGTWLINLPAVAFPFQEERGCGWVQAIQDQTELVFELRSLKSDHPEHGESVRIELS